MELHDMINGIVTEDQTKLMEEISKTTDLLRAKLPSLMELYGLQISMGFGGMSEECLYSIENEWRDEINKVNTDFKRYTESLEHLLALVKAIDINSSLERANETIQHLKELDKSAEAFSFISVSRLNAKYDNRSSAETMEIVARTDKRVDGYTFNCKTYNIAEIKKRNTLQILKAVQGFIAENPNLIIQKAQIDRDVMRPEYKEMFKEINII